MAVLHFGLAPALRLFAILGSEAPAFCSSFLCKQESSDFVFNGLEALDPSFRWDDERNQTFLGGERHVVDQ